jgi:ribulose-bisphosphate carboxylase large chain
VRRDLVGRIERIDGDEVQISYDPALTGGEVAQFINVIWGNVSLFEGVRVIGLNIPTGLFQGPRFGVTGLRDYFQASSRPLLATALKPMGLSAGDLAIRAKTLAAAGLDIVKDDHSLANQKWAEWKDRVKACSAAVMEANAETGGRSIYLPTLNVPTERLIEAAFEAKTAGAGGLLMLPGLSGFDSIRALASDDSFALPLMAHPSMLGSLVVNPQQGLDHGVVLGALMRIAGADMSIYPNYGGRFTFSREHCREIQDACLRPFAGLKPIWPSPGGGIATGRVDELLEFYSRDVVLLIGGSLHHGDLSFNARQIVEKLRTSV